MDRRRERGIPLPRLAHRVARPVQGLQPRSGGGAAVIEAAILVSRLRLLPREKIEREMHYLEIAIGKTASADELEAWNWLVDAVTGFYAGGDTQNPADSP
jgi:hypothetical protein